MFADRIQQSALPIGFMLVLTLVSFWLRSVVDRPERTISKKLRHDPDLILTQFVAHRLGPTGKLEQTLKAATMRHFGDDDLSDFSQVTLTGFEPNKPTVQVTADHAERLHDNETIFFSGHVTVTQAGSKADPEPWVINTEHLEVYPNQKQGQTRAAVTLSHGREHLEAVNMVFNYDLSLVKFERAHIVYAPRPH